DGIGIVQARGAYDVVGGVPRFSRNAAGSAGAPAAPGAARGAGGGRGRGGGGPGAAVPVLLVRGTSLAALRTDGQPVEIHLYTETFEYPSTNVIGVVRGTDPRLRDEYVLFSSHQDHDGVRYAVNGDS